MALAPLPPLYPTIHYGFSPDLPEHALFLGSGREAMAFLTRQLLREQPDSVFVLPAYTCETVTAAVEGAGGRVVFVDVDERLDLHLADLAEVLHQHRDARPVLVPTSLFGAPVRDYKRLYPQAVVVEDLCQAVWPAEPGRADYAFLSFGMGKPVSGMGGGVLLGAGVERWREAHRALPTLGSWAPAMAASVVLRQVVLRWAWRWFQARLDAAEEAAAPVEAIEPRRLSDRWARWVNHSRQQAQWGERIALADHYARSLPEQARFHLPTGLPYLRYPVRHPMSLPGCSSGRMYEQTWRRAQQQRGKTLPGAQALVECGLLPTHRRVTAAHQAAYLSALMTPHTGGAA